MTKADQKAKGGDERPEDKVKDSKAKAGTGSQELTDKDLGAVTGGEVWGGGGGSGKTFRGA